jgi:beta-glucanase (GH16 family)
MNNLKKYFLLTVVVLVFIQCESRKTTTEAVSTMPYKLVWADEFDEDGLPNTEKWNYDVGDGCPFFCGWGNKEKQYFTKNRAENARVENGHLIIEARKENFKASEYTSARLVTKGKADFKYGKIEARIKLPSGVGTWPAFWMMPSDNRYGGWPKSGEIDIMEHVGYDSILVHGTVHTEAYNHMIGTHKNNSVKGDDYETEFHVYSIEWTAEKIDFFIDGKKYFTFDNEHDTSAEWPFDQPFYIILNLTVGGSWGGVQGVDDTIFPQKYIIDYVRVYQN